jgi:tetratricopeptide (TPR) repeat protein
MLTEAFQKIRDGINNQFGYRRITNENVRFERIGKKKHLEYAKYAKAVETIKKGFELMDPDKSLDPVKVAVEPALTFYKTQEKVYPAHDDDLSKIKHICLYNLALAYFWLEDFDQATKYTQALLKMDEKDRDAKRLLEDIDYVKLSLERAKKSSRHQVPVARS